MAEENIRPGEIFMAADSLTQSAHSQKGVSPCLNISIYIGHGSPIMDNGDGLDPMLLFKVPLDLPSQIRVGNRIYIGTEDLAGNHPPHESSIGIAVGSELRPPREVIIGEIPLAPSDRRLGQETAMLPFSLSVFQDVDIVETMGT